MKQSFQHRIERARIRALLLLAPPALKTLLVSGEKLHVNGLIRARAVPFDTLEEWRYWWLCEQDSKGKVIRPARMSEREKDRYTVAEAPNILVSSGITQLLNYVGSQTGNSTA